MLIRHIHHHSKKDKLILMLKQHYCSISDDQQLHNKSKPVSNLLYDNACKYYQINHKWQISKHEIRFPLHFTKILNPYKSAEHSPQVSYTWEKKSLPAALRQSSIYTHMKLLLAIAALQWWPKPDKHFNNCRASKGYHTPPLSKVDQLYKEHHSNFIVVGDWSVAVKISAHFTGWLPCKTCSSMIRPETVPIPIP